MAHELVYCGDEEESMIKIYEMILTKFPTAMFEKDFDDIHGFRLQVEIPDVEQEVYYEFALENQIAHNGLSFGLDSRMNPGKIVPIMKKLKEQGKEIG